MGNNAQWRFYGKINEIRSKSLAFLSLNCGILQTSQYVTTMLHKMEELIVTRKTGQFGLKTLMDFHSFRQLENTMFSIHGQKHVSVRFEGNKTTATILINATNSDNTIIYFKKLESCLFDLHRFEETSAIFSTVTTTSNVLIAKYRLSSNVRYTQKGQPRVLKNNINTNTWFSTLSLHPANATCKGC